MSLIIDTDDALELAEQLSLFVTPNGRQYLDRLKEVIKWSSRTAASRQLAQVIGSGMSRPMEVTSAINYLRRLTATKFTPSPGQARVKERDIESFFTLLSQMYDKGLWQPAEDFLGDYPLIFPESGDKYICAHPRSACECGMLQPNTIASPYCDECGRPRKLCNAPALVNGRCADHGGRLPDGQAKGSVYRQFMTPDIADFHARVETDGNLSLNAELAIAVTWVAKLAGEAQGIDTKKIKKLQADLEKAVEGEDEGGILRIGAELRNAVNEMDGGRIGEEIRRWLQVIASLTQQERENRKAAAEFIHIDEVERDKDALIEAFRVGMDRSYTHMRKLTGEFIVAALQQNPGDDPNNVAQVVIRNLLNSQSGIELELMSGYREL